MIRILLAHGSDMDATDSEGNTPAMLALLCSNEAAFFHLAASNAQLEMTRDNGLGIVRVAVLTGSMKVRDVLAGYGEQGTLWGVDIGVLHKGHDIYTCFETCRNSWSQGLRDIEAGKVKFGELSNAFACLGQGMMGPHLWGQVDSLLR